MARQLILMNKTILDAINTYELATAVDGLTNLRAIIETKAKISIKGKPILQEAGCGQRNKVEKILDSITLQMKSEAWLIIVNDLLTNFTTSSKAQLAIALFLPAYMLDFSNFDLIGSFYQDTILGGNLPALGLAPWMGDIFYEVGGNGTPDGFIGDTVKGIQLQRGVANVVKAKVSTVLNSVNMVFDLKDADSKILESSKSAAVSAGLLSFSLTPTAGASINGVVKIKEIVYRARATSNALLTDLNLVDIPGFISIYQMGYLT